MAKEQVITLKTGDAVKNVQDLRNNIKLLKEQLADTDYKAIKHAEGWLTDEEYAPTKAQRQQWRARINELEGGSDQ